MGPYLRRRMRALVLVGLVTTAVAGCVRRDTSATATATPPTATAPATTRSTVPALYDGFEGDAVAKFWLPGDYGTGRYVPGDIRIAGSPVRSGAHSVEITVHEGDVEAAGDANTRVERAELDSGHFPLRGQEAWYGFSVFVPRDFPIVDNRLVISSCKQSDVSRPLTAQRFRNGRHTLTVESQGRKETFKLPDLPLGKWVDFVCRAKYSTGEDGAFEMWMDGRKVASYTGPLADPQQKNAFYHKVGLYRDRMKQPMTIYFDNYAMGDSYEAVDPARFEANAATSR